MPNIVGTSFNQVPTNGMLGGLAYQDTDNAVIKGAEIENISAIKAKISQSANRIFVYDTRFTIYNWYKNFWRWSC